MSAAPKFTPAMLRELRAIRDTGEPGDLFDYNAANQLAFHSREKVLTALLRRDAIEPQDGRYALTDTGRTALAKVQP